MVIGELAVVLAAKTQQFVTDFRKSEKAVVAFGESTVDTGKSLSAGLTLPIAAAGAAIVGIIAKTTQLADQFLLLSQKSGISTTAIQELQFAGDIAGVSIETLTNSSAVLTRNIVDASNGVGEAKDSIAALGLQITDSNGALKSQETLFFDTVRALGAVENATERSALAQEVFGRGGKEIIPLLELGAGGLDKMRARAHELGLVMGGETIKSFDTLDDKLTELSGAFTGAMTSIATGFLPLIEDSLFPAIEQKIIPAIQTMADMVRRGVDAFVALPGPVQAGIAGFVGILAAIGPLAIALGSIMTLMPVITAGFATLGTVIAAISLPVLVAVAAVGSLVAAWVFFSDEIIQFGGAVIDGFLVPAINKAIDVLNLWIAGFNSLSEMVGGPTIDALQRMDETGKTTGTRFIESMHGMNDSVSNFVGGLVDSAVPSMFDLDSKVQGVSASTGIMTGQITLADKALDRMSETSETLSKSLDKTDEAMGRIPVTLTPIPDSISAIQDASNNMKDALSSTFDQLSNKSISFGGALKSLAGTALKEIGRISGLSGKLAGLFGGGVGGGGGLLSGALGAGLSFLPGGGLLKGIGRGFGLFDEGGITTKAGFVEVGQRGVPEAHIPLSRAKEFGFGGNNGGGTTRLIVELDGEVIAEKIFDNLAIKGFD